MCFGVCAKLYAAVFRKSNGGSCYECPWEGIAGQFTLDRIIIHPEFRVVQHYGDHCIWGFLERKGVPCALDSFFCHLDFSLNFRIMFIGGSSIEVQSSFL